MSKYYFHDVDIPHELIGIRFTSTIFALLFETMNPRGYMTEIEETNLLKEKFKYLNYKRNAQKERKTDTEIMLIEKQIKEINEKLVRNY